MKPNSTLFRLIIVAVVLMVPVSMLCAQTPSWEQIGAEIFGEEGNSQSGRSVSISADGKIIAIGANQNNGNGANSGQVRVYENNAGVWEKKGQDIDGEAAGDEFGRYVCLSSDGSILAAGAPFNDGIGTNSGHVRVYSFNSLTSLWEQLGADIEGEAAGDEQGTSVCLSADGTIVAMGAYKNDDGGEDRGHTRIYKYDGSNWDQIGADIDGEADFDYSGYSVSLSADGSIVAIGAHKNDAGGGNAGHVRVYKFNVNTWDQVGSDIDGQQAGEESGVSVSLNDDGSILAIGAYKYNSQVGCTRVYKNDGGSWTQIGANIVGEAGASQSGKFVSLNSTGTIVVIGDPLSDGITPPGYIYAGQTRVFYNNGGTWTQLGQDIEGGAVNEYCGYGFAISNDGTKLAVGYYGALAETGKVVVFDLKATETWTGTTDNDWLKPENWDLGIVPTNNISAIIPADLTNYPTLTAAAICDDLTLESNATSTASILGQSNLTVTGTTSIQRQMTGNAWYLLASPAPGQTIESFLTDNTNIPTNGASLRGMMDYNEATNSWSTFYASDKPGNLTAGKGFSVRTNADGIVEFSGGTLEASDVTPAVTSTNPSYSWNCIGNPYPSAIFMNSNANATNNFIDLNAANIDPSFKAIYVWEDGSGSYVGKSFDDPAYTAALGQAFFVKANTGATQMNFSTDLQTHAPTTVLKSGNSAISQIQLTAQLSTYKSSTVVKFDDNMNAGLDPGYDIGIFKSGFNLFTSLVEDNGVDFGKQFLPTVMLNNAEIAVGLESNKSGLVSFSMSTENIPVNCKVILEDRLTGTFTELSGTEVYNAEITKNETGKGRFYLHVSSSTTKIGDISETSDFSAYYSNEKIVISGKVQGNAHAIVFDMMGRKIKELKLENAPINNISTNGMKNGIYILNIQHEGGLFTKKIPLNR